MTKVNSYDIFPPVSTTEPTELKELNYIPSQLSQKYELGSNPVNYKLHLEKSNYTPTSTNPLKAIGDQVSAKIKSLDNDLHKF